MVKATSFTLGALLASIACAYPGPAGKGPLLPRNHPLLNRRQDPSNGPNPYADIQFVVSSEYASCGLDNVCAEEACTVDIYDMNNCAGPADAGFGTNGQLAGTCISQFGQVGNAPHIGVSGCADTYWCACAIDTGDGNLDRYATIYINGQHGATGKCVEGDDSTDLAYECYDFIENAYPCCSP